ncbi:hypothetical protein [Pseudomonas marincola]|nr:hypothetical protein [Pseudomonas marincola]SFT52004.1 hypothetical protein SAMN05216264_101740 [Pseudomonas marincola]
MKIREPIHHWEHNAKGSDVVATAEIGDPLHDKDGQALGKTEYLLKAA